MPAIAASAPGKVILFGEHAVVYTRPAIAVPVTQVQARVTVAARVRAPAGEVLLQAPDIQLESRLDALPAGHPLAIGLAEVRAALGIARFPALTIRIQSTIPVASGLGSGAAVTVALVRAVAGFLGQPLTDEQVNAVAFSVEKAHHGTPSGIDNTVITYRQPVYFIRGLPMERLSVPAAFTLLIGDTGVQSPTGAVVADVRARWQAEPERYEGLFDEAGAIAQEARKVIETGRPDGLGLLFDRSQQVLQKLGVSSPDLDRLVETARRAGALGAKLSGGGRGGNMIALVTSDNSDAVRLALTAAGAVRVIRTQVGPDDLPQNA
jgi:mevalonate kinase